MTYVESLIFILGCANLVFGLTFLFKWPHPDYPFAAMNFVSAALCFITALN